MNNNHIEAVINNYRLDQGNDLQLDRTPFIRQSPLIHGIDGTTRMPRAEQLRRFCRSLQDERDDLTSIIKDIKYALAEAGEKLP